MKNRLKELRQLHQWSQSDLARELGVSRQAVNGFESGKFDPSLDMAFKIASLFDVAIEDVFIYEAEAKHSMQTLVERVKNFFGFDFGFERFTEQAIHAIKFAQNEAVRLQNLQVEPEHLLVGLLADPTTTAARLLRAVGVKVDIETNEHSFESRENLRFSPQSKFVLALALQVVRLQNKKSIGTEHLLWALVRLAETDKTTLTDLFQRYKIDLAALNNQLAEMV
ncbi:helix-turn-helix transcriptional regulator [Gloeocapsopsis dulcis]|uniref:Transcriptional regulator n=1 Tax=Gloeocapsopsis dulcis AAB1 = 1H9 TaxID=1433147 RepID=A0A6N8FVI4_9CHRO|nr:helix-turn-helix transcriptional regulator [Gloeocapsopsis dulcis]MUL36335.1 transcriptional regulator [Gloeocapsopsis dulcis AAB1 = 1H9]WNN88169.1 helix-turn-helix domain-containing protein [Gloeocapsopsis dulcis]